MRWRVRSLDGSVVELGVSGGSWVAGGSGPLEDLSGLWAVPGLVDAHIHLGSDEMDFTPPTAEYLRRRAFTELEGGVFLAFDKGWSDDGVLVLLDAPLDRRPTLQAAGRVVAGTDGYYPDSVLEVDPEQLSTAVAAVIGRGGWVKLIGDWPRRGVGAIPSFSEEHLAAAVAVAHQGGSRVAIHTMAPDTPSMAVRAGIDSIEHGLFLTEDDVRALGERGGAWVPTVCQVERLIGMIGADRTGGRLLAAGLERVRELAAVAPDAGVHVLTGSDFATPQGGIGHEAVRLTEYGFTPEAALDALTMAGYRYAGESAGFFPELGADVVAFAAHPVEQITTVTEPVYVMRRGTVLVDRRPT